MLGTAVCSLVWEDPTGCEATRPVLHNYWACALEPWSWSFWSLWAYKPMLHNKKSPQRDPHVAMKSSLCSMQPEKACMQPWRLTTAKKINLKKKQTMHLWLSVFPRSQNWQLSPNLGKGVSPQPERTKPVKMIYQSAPCSHKFLLNKMTNVQRLQVKIQPPIDDQ